MIFLYFYKEVSKIEIVTVLKELKYNLENNENNENKTITIRFILVTKRGADYLFIYSLKA